MLDVYAWEANSNSGKPLIFLAKKDAEFNFHYVDIGKFEQHQPEYLALNPQGTVHTVIHDGKIMTDSYVHNLPDMLRAIVNEEATPNIIDWLAKIGSRPGVIDAIAKRRSTLAPVLHYAPKL